MADQDPNQPTYSIGEVRERTGLSSRQIRYYEAMGLIESLRTNGKHRRFTEEMIDRLLTIKELLKEKSSIEAVRQALQQPGAGQSGLQKKTPALPRYPQMSRQGLTSLYPVSNRADLLAMIQWLEGQKKMKTNQDP
ncbi:MAG TPA: MerR family transcriptional regulator [Firmicutes bacterium]|uniref:MerR family transcriptional regulator n=1 Tax=Capillibacterium thermochitinicola TaxID=2699427 RepID=A0A8J6LHH3_9FIRM|nr:MerR family transcriptional regulator [Capillibacterium thermochitinicola]MBA2132125.1 MerR family transcriptional regulator [Capillibacterium thermochitinicola]HHW12647.1 MerR family transcriptional regulator [Bacillota bacterium]